MPRATRLLVIPMEGRTEEAEERAFAGGLEEFFRYLYQHGAGVRNAAIYFPIIGNLDGTMSRLLGVEWTNRLRRGGSLRFTEGVEVHARSRRTIRKHPRPEVVLALFADMKMLNLLDESAGVRAVFVVPWEWDEVRSWAEKRSAEILGKARS